MPKMTRREWGLLTLGGLVGANAACFSAPRPRPTPKPRMLPRRYKQVDLGVDSASFRDRPVDEAIKALTLIGLGSAALGQNHLEPQGAARLGREELRHWRLSTPLEEIAALGTRFTAAGIALSALDVSFGEDFSDAEIERTFLMARVLGVKLILSATPQGVVKRLDAFARQYQIAVGLRNISRGRPGDIVGPEDFKKALQGVSPHIGICLDLGELTAAGFDCLEVLNAHRPQLLAVRLRDRKRALGPDLPFGLGDTPLTAALQLLRQKRWRVPALISYEYSGRDTIDEVRACVAFCKKALDEETRPQKPAA